MKAFLLAGGQGERLRPLTSTIPKCLAPVSGRPLLGYWLELCRREGVTDVLMNVSHHFEAVEAFLSGEAHALPRVTVVRETAPVGTATTVRRERQFVAGAGDFWVLYADNLSDLHMDPMLERHRTHGDPLTIGLFHTAFPKASGIVELDDRGRVTAFAEKPAQPRSDLANAGVYLARQSLFQEIPGRDGLLDFGQHVLPTLVGRMHGYVIPDFHEDIGTPERLAQASARWASRFTE